MRLQPTEGATDLGAMSGCLLFVSTVVVVLRMYARKAQRAGFGADDFVMIGAWLTFVGTMAVVFYAIDKKVYGYPSTTPGLPSREGIVKIYLTFDMVSTPCIGLVKISVLLFFQRIFCLGTHWNRFRIVVTVWVALVSAWTIAYTIIPPFQCGVKVSNGWTHKGGPCRTGLVWLLSSSIIDLVFEVTILIMPVPMIWALHTTTRRKLGLVLVFLTALVSLGACIARLVIFAYTFNVQPGSTTEDPGLLNTKDVYMNVLEAGMALIAANMPSLYSLSEKIAGPKTALRAVRTYVSTHITSSSARTEDNQATMTTMGPAATTTWLRKGVPPRRSLDAVDRDALNDKRRKGSDSSASPLVTQYYLRSHR